MDEYQIKYKYTALLGITVQATSLEKAMSIAEKRVEAPIKDGIEILDDRTQPLGSDNLTLWDLD